MKYKALKLLTVLVLCLTLLVGCKKKTEKIIDDPKYTVTFNVEGNTTLIDSQTVNRFGKITKPENPTKTNYDFEGWYYNDELWNFSGCVVTEDMTLEARFVEKVYHIYVQNPNLVLLTSNLMQCEGGYICKKEDHCIIKPYSLPKKGHALRWTIWDEKTGIENAFSFCINEFPFTNVDSDIHITIEEVEIYEVEDNSIYFGYYPQTLEDNDSIIARLNSLSTPLPDASNSNGWSDYYGYDEHFMWYKDIDLDNDGRYDYRGVYFIKYRGYTPLSTTNESETIQDDNGYELETVYWFKYEKIKWDILEEDDDRMLVVSSLNIDTQEFSRMNSSYGYDNYEMSFVREWLNEVFYNTAFSSLEKDFILMEEVDNSAATTDYTSYNPSACDNTWDWIFLLSYQEALGKVHGLEVTDYAKSQGCFEDCSRLRSPSGEEGRAPLILYNNGNNATNTYSPYWTCIGLKPALRLPS